MARLILDPAKIGHAIQLHGGPWEGGEKLREAMRVNMCRGGGRETGETAIRSTGVVVFVDVGRRSAERRYRTYDFPADVPKAKRVVVFRDAHGYDW